MHATRMRRTGRLERTVSYRCPTSTGYIRVYAPNHPMAMADGWGFEHRVVAYDQGWLTGPDDKRQVHHINHDKTDNRPDNLQVVTSSQHRAMHARIDWSKAPAMYESGMTTVEIAAALGTDPGGVSRNLRRMGVRMRTGSEALARYWQRRKSSSLSLEDA